MLCRLPQSYSDDDDTMISQQYASLLFLLRPSGSCDVDQLSGTDLAYIGDVVYELYIRSRTVWPLKRTTDLQQQAVSLVRGNTCFWVHLFDD
jgi:hypothetical protein